MDLAGALVRRGRRFSISKTRRVVLVVLFAAIAASVGAWWHLQSYVVPSPFSYYPFCARKPVASMIVSLATIPPKLEMAAEGVRRLLEFPCVRRVLVQLPRTFARFSWDPDRLPALASLEALVLESGGRVVLNRDAEDLGPATKVMGIRPDDLVGAEYLLHVDDDIVYKNLCALDAPEDGVLFGSLGKSYVHADEIILPVLSFPCINAPVDTLWGVGGVLMTSNTWRTLIHRHRPLFRDMFYQLSADCRRLDDNTLADLYRWVNISTYVVRSWYLIDDYSASMANPHSTSRDVWDEQFRCHIEARNFLSTRTSE